MPAPSCRMNPARTSSLWEATWASAGASFRVGMKSRLKRATFMIGGLYRSAARTGIAQCAFPRAPGAGKNFGVPLWRGRRDAPGFRGGPLNYPVWELDIGGGLLVAAFAVTHSFVAH